MNVPNIELVASEPVTAAPSLANDLAPVERGHSVQFYENDQFLAAAVADFLVTGLTNGEQVVVIATEEHRGAFSLRLSARGIDVERARRGGQLTLMDAGDTLRQFMVGAMPDRSRFMEIMGSVIDGNQRGSSLPRLRFYGEMVDVLWKAGNTDGAVRLEELWNELGASYPFNLLCAYSIGNFYKSTDAEKFAEICGKHTHVIPVETFVTTDEESRALEISRLQQRARALESEILHRQQIEERLRDALLAARRAEEALRQSEQQLQEQKQLLELARASAEAANRAKSDFLAAMSHELRTPLNAIGGYLQLLDMGLHGSVSEEQRSVLARISKSEQHLLSLINDVLNFAKLEAGRVEYDLNDVVLAEVIEDVRAMIEPQLTAKNLTLRIDVPRDVSVQADREKLRQIVLNLLSNAVKFTDQNGRIAIETTVSDLIYLRVTDTGIGIPGDKQDAIFDPFVQINRGLTSGTEGTGLGLAISRDLAKGMGGDIRVRSAEGQGSSFTLTLKRSDDRQRG